MQKYFRENFNGVETVNVKPSQSFHVYSTYIHTYIHTYTHTYTYVYTYVYIHIHIHTYIYTYCIVSNYGSGIYFFSAIFNQATKRDRHLLEVDSRVVYNLLC